MSTAEDRTIALGERARALMDDPLMQSALAAIRQALVSAFFSTPAEDAAKREMLHLMDRARQHFEAALTTLISDAEIAMHERSQDDAQAFAQEQINRLVQER